jgi:hypothetical protein
MPTKNLPFFLNIAGFPARGGKNFPAGPLLPLIREISRARLNSPGATGDTPGACILQDMAVSCENQWISRKRQKFARK